MFKIAEDTELNHISLTGARALVLIGLLSVKPRSFEEIKTNLIFDLKLIALFINRFISTSRHSLRAQKFGSMLQNQRF